MSIRSLLELPNFQLAKMSGNNTTAPNLLWNDAATSLCVVSTVTLLINGYVLFLFVKHRLYYTSFSQCLVNLLCANIYLTLADPARVLWTLQAQWFPKSFLCSILIYSDWVGSAIVIHAHLLITINRIWASGFPASYWTHSTRATTLSCVVAFVYCHLLPGSFLVIDYVLYRSNKDSVTECGVAEDEQEIFSKFLEIWVYIAPVLMILAAYPYLFWKRRDIARVSIRRLSRNTGMAISQIADARKTNNGNGFVVLTVITISILLCWTPSKVYGILTTFFDIDVKMLASIGDVLYSLQAILDPILFALTLKDLRDAVKAHFESVKTLLLKCLLR